MIARSFNAGEGVPIPNNIPIRRQLAQWGPGAPRRPAPTLAEASEYCRRLARNHYENFTVASWLLPRALRRHFCHIYAYCRWADDLADEAGDATECLQLLDWWESELNACFRGEARHPIYVALWATVREFDIPRAPFADLLRAFRQDQIKPDYATFEELLDYCRFSANPVGRLVLYVGRCHNAENLALADSVCTGLQLANFWQDVDRDLDKGRVYLPREDRERFGYTDESLSARRYDDAFATLMQFQVYRAADYLRGGIPLVELVPRRLRMDVSLFIRGGLAILAAIRRERYNVWERRPTLSRWVKAKLFLSTAMGTRPKYGNPE